MSRGKGKSNRRAGVPYIRQEIKNLKLSNALQTVLLAADLAAKTVQLSIILSNSKDSNDVQGDVVSI